MLYIVDLLRKGDEHRTTNFPTLKALDQHALIDHLWFSADSSSLDAIKDKSKIQITEINVEASSIYRWLISTFYTIIILIRSTYFSKDTFFLSTTPLHNFLISIFSIFVRKRCRFYIYLHGELSYLVESSSLGKNLGKFFLRFVLKHSSHFNVKYIVLAYPVYHKLFQVFGEISNLYPLDFPVIEKVVRTKQDKKNRIRVGSFGVHSAEKNSSLIYEYAKKSR
jgi:hypothetical protein